MPEGDSLHLLARRLAPALEGRVIVAAEAPRAGFDAERLVGRRVERVEALGKNLLVRFEGGLALHTHLAMTGAWHLYRAGERWRMPRWVAVAALRTEEHEAVCFRAPVARLVRAGARPAAALEGLASLGPDLAGPALDLAAALARVRARGAEPIGEVLLDQRVVAGIGNVYKSEVLFAERLDPFAPVDAFTDEELSSALRTARRLLVENVRRGGPRTTQAAVEGRGPVAVYRRAGRACPVCGATVRMARQGALQRSTYFCPSCQPRRAVAPPDAPK